MLQTILALLLGKLIYFLTRLSKGGGGSAAPGLYALKIDPNIVSHLAQKIPQNVLVTGTNGKTTTSKLLAHFIESEKLAVIRNSTGSNLERGIASTLVSKADLLGNMNNSELGIWELDEAAFNKVVFQIKPQIILFLNAFRDQLDRYGEVDSVCQKWQETLSKIDWNPLIIVNADDANTSRLKSVNNNNLIGFSVLGNHYIGEKNKLGPQKEIETLYKAKILQNLGLEGVEIELLPPLTRSKFKIPLPGIYHVYDFLAAFAIYYNLNLNLDGLQERLQTFAPAFGRVERLKIEKHEGFIFLIKNPAGASQVLETIAPELKGGDTILLALNDNFADGTDVSWIWDAEFERLVGKSNAKIICSGTRAGDLAIRLKYAGVTVEHLSVENDLNKALFEASSHTTGRIFILPTYTALLELQDILAKMGVKEHYWKEN